MFPVQGLNWALYRAISYYKKKPDWWRKLVKKVMKIDFSWDISADQYVDLYNQIVTNVHITKAWVLTQCCTPCLQMANYLGWGSYSNSMNLISSLSTLFASDFSLSKGNISPRESLTGYDIRSSPDSNGPLRCTVLPDTRNETQNPNQFEDSNEVCDSKILAALCCTWALVYGE